MKITASILAMIAFVAIFMTVLTEARLGLGRRGRPKYPKKNKNKKMDINEFVDYGRTYRLNGYTMDSRRYLANPTRSAQIKARNAGALTNSEARSMGLKNYRDEMVNNEFVGRPSYRDMIYHQSHSDKMDNDEFVGRPSYRDMIYYRSQRDEMDNDEFVGTEPLLCHSRRGRNCGYLEYYKPNGKIDFNSPHYSSWRGDHPKGSLGGHRYDLAHLISYRPHYRSYGNKLTPL